MAGLYQFTVQLNDKVSEPAKHAEGGMASFGEVMGQVKNSITTAVAGISNAFESVKSGDFGEAFQSMAETVAGLAKSLDLVVPGLGEAVSALVEVGGLIGGITIGLVQKGAELSLEASEAKEKMTALFDALGGGVSSGEDTIKMLDNLSGQVGLTRQQLAPLAQQFEAMGTKDLPTLQKQLTAAASAQALMGAAGAQAYADLSKKIQNAIESGGKLKLSSKALGQQLASVGLDLNDVAKAMGTTGPALAAALKGGTVDATKFGDAMQKALIDKGKGPLEKMAGSFEFLKTAFKENIGKLFEDVDVTPFTNALKDLGSVFGTNTASGKTMKTVITGFFNEVFKLAGKVIPYIKHLFLDLIIIGLKAYIFLKPYIKSLEDLWVKAKGGEQVKTMFKGLAVVVGLFGAAVLLSFAPLIIAVGAIVAVGVAIGWLVGKLIDFAPKAIKAIEDWVKSAKSSAENFIQGLIDGIKNGVGLVEDAIKGLGKGAMKALKGVLGISSPSKVMMEFGVQTGAGFSKGIQNSTAKVTEASQGLAQKATVGVQSVNPQEVAAPVGPTIDMALRPESYNAPGTQPGTDKATSSKKGSLHNITVNVQIDGAGKEAMEITEEMVSTVFEKLALSQGL